MTITSTLRKAGPFVGNSSATSFAFEFKVFETSDVVVTRTTVATGAESTLVENTDYTVALNADQNNDPGGTVTYPVSGSPMASTHKLTLTSDVPRTQETDITNAGGFYPETIEDALDKAIIAIQQLAEQVGRVLTVSVSDTAPGVLPTAAERALKYLAFDADGDPIASEGGGSASPVSAAMEPVVAAATLADARAELGVAAAGLPAANIGATATITVSQLQQILVSSTNGAVYTLPILSSVSSGAMVAFASNANMAAGFTIAANAADGIASRNGTGSLTLKYFSEGVLLVAVPANNRWYVVGSDCVFFSNRAILELTEDTAPDSTNDWLVTYDTSAAVNKKASPYRLRASAAQVLTGTDDTVFLTPARLTAALGFSGHFASAAQTLTAAGALTIAHSLGRKPILVIPVLVAQSAPELGYTEGDEVFIDYNNDASGTTNRFLSVVPDATNLNVRFGSDASCFNISNKGTGAVSSITLSKWKLILRAWA